MELRKMQSQDEALFIDMATEFYASEVVSHKIPIEHMRRAFQEVVSDNPFVDALFICHEKQEVGYALLGYTYSMEAGGKIAILDEFFILPDFRRLRLGSQVLETLSKNREADVVAIRLEIVTGNEGLQKFYEKNGYQMMGYSAMIKAL